MCYCQYYFRCVSHSYLPSALIKVIPIEIVQIGKNKVSLLAIFRTAITRPMAIATMTSKRFESVFVLKCSDYLTTCDNQLGFKASYGNDMCIYTLK